MTTSNSPDAPRPFRRRIVRTFRLVSLGLIILALIASVACNVLLYRQASLNYRRLSEAQLDPYGLKQPNFRPEPPAASDRDLPTVVFFGDSRARDWPAPQVPGLRFVSRGIAGQTTEQVRGRFDAHVTPLSPRVVVVQAGINDLKAIPLLPHRRDEIVGDCKANLQEVVKRSAEGGAAVIVTNVSSA